MGCNTSKEAMQGAGETVEGGKSTTEDAVKLDKVAHEEGKSILDTAIDQPEIPNGAILEPETVTNVVGHHQDNILNDQVEKAKQALAKTAKLEVTDINLNDPEANRAATKIQAAFRGHKTRKSMKQGDAESKQNLEKEFSSEDKELCEAATKIQASFRGHLVRKSAPRKDEEEELSRELTKLDAKAPEEELDIDLTDPDLQVAATKIQASFRGHRVRKEKQSGSNE